MLGRLGPAAAFSSNLPFISRMSKAENYVTNDGEGCHSEYLINHFNYQRDPESFGVEPIKRRIVATEAVEEGVLPFHGEEPTWTKHDI